MTGVENITAKILKTARDEADAILREATEECGKAVASMREEIERMTEDITEKARVEAEAIEARILSAAEMDARKLLLAKKQELIAQAMEKAVIQLISMDEDKYQKLLQRMIEKASRDFNEEIILNERDKALISPQFEYLINHELSKDNVNAQLKLSEQTADIRGGFILKQGDIEYSFSFDSIVAMLRDELEPELAALLFERG